MISVTTLALILSISLGGPGPPPLAVYTHFSLLNDFQADGYSRDKTGTGCTNRDDTTGIAPGTASNSKSGPPCGSPKPKDSSGEARVESDELPANTPNPCAFLSRISLLDPLLNGKFVAACQGALRFAKAPTNQEKGVPATSLHSATKEAEEAAGTAVSRGETAESFGSQRVPTARGVSAGTAQLRNMRSSAAAAAARAAPAVEGSEIEKGEGEEHKDPRIGEHQRAGKRSGTAAAAGGAGLLSSGNLPTQGLPSGWHRIRAAVQSALIRLRQCLFPRWRATLPVGHTTAKLNSRPRTSPSASPCSASVAARINTQQPMDCADGNASGRSDMKVPPEHSRDVPELLAEHSTSPSKVSVSAAGQQGEAESKQHRVQQGGTNSQQRRADQGATKSPQSREFSVLGAAEIGDFATADASAVQSALNGAAGGALQQGLAAADSSLGGMIDVRGGAARHVTLVHGARAVSAAFQRACAFAKSTGGAATVVVPAWATVLLSEAVEMRGPCGDGRVALQVRRGGGMLGRGGDMSMCGDDFVL